MTETLAGARILVAEDERELRALLALILVGEGYRVIEARTGAEALERALAELPDLLILDLRLPDGSGLDVARALRRDPRTSSLPVLLLTAWREPGDRERARAAGADVLLRKPFSPDELCRVVGDLLGAGARTT